jgi:hypothetical protein
MFSVSDEKDIPATFLTYDFVFDPEDLEQQKRKLKF